MPKKKVQHKGKSKLSDENDGIAYGKSDRENTEEEYETVVDSDINKKYSKRVIQSNWSKYEENLLNFESGEEVNEPPKTNDFNHLLNTASSDCSHFQFNSEKLWNSEENSVHPSNIFNLDLNILASGLACVPFYERVGLDKSRLSLEDQQRLDAEAEKCLKDYTLLREKLKKNVENVVDNKSDDNISALEESFKDKIDLKVNKTEAKPEGYGEKDLDISNEDKEEIVLFENKESDEKKGEKKSQIFFSENDEDLEDWLDSVLDD